MVKHRAPLAASLFSKHTEGNLISRLFPVIPLEIVNVALPFQRNHRGVTTVANMFTDVIIKSGNLINFHIRTDGNVDWQRKKNNRPLYY